MNELIVFTKRSLDALLLPPGGLLLIMMFGLALHWRAKAAWRRHGGLTILLAAMIGLYLSCTSAGVWWLSAFLEDGQTAQTEASLAQLMASPQAPQAIVVLGGGSRLDLRETPQQFSLHPRTLQRVQHGAWIQRMTNLPILVSGGAPRPDWPSEAHTMAQVLNTDFGRSVRWQESESLDTRDNANMSARQLAKDGIQRVILVTHAAHMPRSLRVFTQAGLEVTPAPHGFSGAAGANWQQAWWPRADAIGQTWLICHELLGSLWYRLSTSR